MQPSCRLPGPPLPVALPSHTHGVISTRRYDVMISLDALQHQRRLDGQSLRQTVVRYNLNVAVRGRFSYTLCH